MFGLMHVEIHTFQGLSTVSFIDQMKRNMLCQTILTRPFEETHWPVNVECLSGHSRLNTVYFMNLFDEIFATDVANGQNCISHFKM